MLGKIIKKRFTNLIKVEYNDLIAGKNLQSEIHQAFGTEGLGLIVVKHAPNIHTKRTNMLKDGFDLAHLNKDELKKLEKPKANHTVGWGKGTVVTENEREYLTAFFYARVLGEHPIYDEDPQLQKDYRNVWPSEEQLPSFKKNFIQLGISTSFVQLHLLKHLDLYIQSFLPSHKTNQLFDEFKFKNDSIARLIMYHPPSTLEPGLKRTEDNWCGWHRDFGLTTALTHAMYFDKKGNLIPNIKSGLLVKDRKGEIHDIKFEEDEIAIQTGDVMFILSGGNIISTPHAVKIKEGMPKDAFRVTYVNFYEPYYSYKIYSPDKLDNIFANDPFAMKDMYTKFRQGCSYKELIATAFESYHG